jgi:flagellar biosynthesis protein FlhA
LLREQVPIRQLALILEVLGEEATHTKHPVQLAERVRQRLARVISMRYRDKSGRLAVLTLDPALEDQILAAIEPSERDFRVRLAPQLVELICQRLAAALDRHAGENRPSPVLLVSPELRPAVKQLTASVLPRLVVLSYDEVTRDTRLESQGLIDVEALHA